jgi:hypothetical protein
VVVSGAVGELLGTTGKTGSFKVLMGIGVGNKMDSLRSEIAL